MFSRAASRCHNVVMTNQRQAWQRACLVNRQSFAAAAELPRPSGRRKSVRKQSSTVMAKRPTAEINSQATAFVETAVAHGMAQEINVRPVDETPERFLAFGDFSPRGIRCICKDKIPGWSDIPLDDIYIDQVCEGLSNQNFKVYVKSENALGVVPCVLFRVYGKDSQTLYDGESELKIVRMLSTYQIAPQLFAHGNGWRIEEWHKSVPLPNRRMRNPSIFTQVAAQLGRFHKLSSRKDFPDDIAAQPVLSAARMDTWSNACLQAAAALKHPECQEQIAALGLDEVIAEKEWLAKYIKADNPKIKGSGLDVVFSHWDSQENNILQTQYGLRFIDFEYSGMEHQAFDIATYFVECMIDYIVDDYPFYKTSLSEYPTDDEMRLFCSVYLSEYLETTVRPNDLSVEVLFGRVQRFALVVHYVWTLWSVIRARQGPTVNDFDYLQFAQTRWFMYKWSKRDVLAKGV